MRYAIIKHSEVATLVQHVNTLLDEGWQLMGNLIVVQDPKFVPGTHPMMYVQTMIHPKLPTYRDPGPCMTMTDKITRPNGSPLVTHLTTEARRWLCLGGIEPDRVLKLGIKEEWLIALWNVRNEVRRKDDCA